MADDVIELIKAQHRQIEHLLEQVARPDADAVGLLRQVAELLEPHSAAEEDFVYPTIKSKADDAGEQVDDSSAEHHHIEGLLRELLAAAPDEPGFDGVLEAFTAELRHHVEEEEQELLPALAEHSTPDERAELGRRFAEATANGNGTAATRGPAGRHAGAPAAEDLTRDELYQRAREQDASGRSTMSKQDLADAVESVEAVE
jgi:hemerythrin superfamily protein